MIICHFCQAILPSIKPLKTLPDCIDNHNWSLWTSSKNDLLSTSFFTSKCCRRTQSPLRWNHCKNPISWRKNYFRKWVSRKVFFFFFIWRKTWHRFHFVFFFFFFFASKFKLHFLLWRFELSDKFGLLWGEKACWKQIVFRTCSKRSIVVVNAIWKSF